MNRKQKQKGYECSQYRTYGKARCKCHEIKESDIIIHLKEFLKFTKEKYQDEINKIEIEVKTNKEQSNKEKIKKLKTAIEYFDEVIFAEVPSR